MAPHQDHEQRLTNLEVKAAFSEDQLDQLDRVIVRQQVQIDALIHQVRRCASGSLWPVRRTYASRATICRRITEGLNTGQPPFCGRKTCAMPCHSAVSSTSCRSNCRRATVLDLPD